MSLRKMFSLEFDPGAGYVVAMLCLTAGFAACEMATAPHILVDEELAPLPECPECVCPVVTCPDAPPASRVRPAPAAPAVPAELIDLNYASPTQLTTLPGVGPATANRIIEHRARRPFKSTRDLMRVRGIGRKTYKKLQPLIRVTPRTAVRIREADR